MALGPDARRAAYQTAGFYAVLFMSLGAYLPYWPVWLSDWGLNETELATWIGIGMIVRVVGSTVVPALADRYAIRRMILAGSVLLAGLIYFAYPAIEDRGVLFAMTIVAAFLLAPSAPIGEALGLRAAQAHGFEYAPVRAAGSVGFLVMNVAVGWLLGFAGADAIVWSIGACCLILAVVGWVHPGGGAPPGGMRDHANGADLRALLGSPTFVMFVLASGLSHGSHAAYYLYSAVDWIDRGISPVTVGWLWSVGVIAETLLMLGPGRAWVAKIGPIGAMLIALGAAVVRWGLMALEPGLLALWPIQALHGLTFGLFHLGVMAYLAAHIPSRMQGSAQGVLSGAFGLSVAVSGMLAGVVAGSADRSASYLLMAAIAIVSSVLLLTQIRRPVHIVATEDGDGNAS